MSTDCSPKEIAAYEVVRQRLLRLAEQHPWIREIPIADERQINRVPVALR